MLDDIKLLQAKCSIF